MKMLTSGLSGVMPPIGRHDVRTRRLLLDRAPEKTEAPVDIFAVRRDQRAFAVGGGEVRIALKPVKMVGIQREENALVQLLDNLLHRQAVDPGVEDPGSVPAAVTGASRLDIRRHQRLNTRARKPISRIALRDGADRATSACRGSILDHLDGEIGLRPPTRSRCAAAPLPRIARPKASS